MTSFGLDRENMARRTSEDWRPPLLINPATRTGKCLSAIRRFFDLQAGSIWQDLSQLLASASGDLLDVGCGSQPYRSLLPVSVRYRAIDLVESETQFGYHAPDTLYYRGETWPIDSASVDLVLSTETLEHVLRPAVFLSESARVLRPGGQVILTVPFSARWHFIPFDYWRYTPSGLASLLSEASFQDIRVYGRGNAVTVACAKVISLAASSLERRSWDAAAVVRALLALLCFPLVCAAVGVAHASLGVEAGEDCLGYTVVAVKP